MVTVRSSVAAVGAVGHYCRGGYRTRWGTGAGSNVFVVDVVGVYIYYMSAVAGSFFCRTGTTAVGVDSTVVCSGMSTPSNVSFRRLSTTGGVFFVNCQRKHVYPVNDIHRIVRQFIAGN